VCRSPKSTLLYISKEDRCPYLFNVRVSELSIFAKCWHHAVTSYTYPQEINRADPFIVGLGQYSRFAITIIEEHLKELRRRLANGRRVFDPNRRCGICCDVMLAISGVQHLYIEGPPGHGKTELIDYCLRGKNYWKAGEPSQFLFGTLTEVPQFIWFEDFEFTKYIAQFSVLLSLMDKKEATIQKKGVDDRTIISNALFIFCSNYPPPSGYPMFIRRIRHIYIDHSLFLCTGCHSDYIPDNQLGLLDSSGEQLALQLNVSDENAGSPSRFDGLHNIMTDSEIESFFETST
jgi:hypothetical protein